MPGTDQDNLTSIFTDENTDTQRGKHICPGAPSLCVEEGRETVRTVALGATCSRHAQKHVTDTLGVHFTLQWPLRVRQAP